MYGGRIVEELEGEAIEEERIMRAALGGPRPVKASAAAANVAEGNVA